MATVTIPALDDVRAARETVRGLVHETPVLSSATLSEIAGAPVWLKAELFQRVGAFKARGAFNRVAALTEEERRRGVIAISAGNHAQALALAAREYGVDALIVMWQRRQRDEDRRDAGLRRVGRHRVLGQPGGAGPDARAAGRDRPRARPPLRRPAGDRRPGHGRPGAGRAGARPGHGDRAGRRRRPDLGDHRRRQGAAAGGADHRRRAGRVGRRPRWASRPASRCRSRRP